MTILKVDQLTKNFGGLTAVSNVSMELEQGELIGLIGPNGAGKTTFFNLLTGVYTPSEGTVSLGDGSGGLQEIQGKRPDIINGLGIARTFQNIRLFDNMTVIENVMVAMDREEGNSLFSSLIRSNAYYETEEKMRKKALELLEIFDLGPFAEDKAKNLAYGQQRRLEIVRALATQPKILFLDEPAAGMNPNETADLTNLIEQIRQQFDLTIVLIEHDMSLVMDICQRIYVLEYGRLIAQGTPEEIQQNEAVIRAYLGGED
ncbi:ABC transporter ATP-binding protein [Hutsoniella sourekii]|uniref:ABC transporter ATP-binding protein n=1 Tax=Hutsoniella sourekii TaxID=87650 RepID=UPI000481891C|nr:ABC transporter ATP-binding protein [Hutsoniella sourekii]